jgi:ABC-type antimicrobial peptide transport system permease subunit|tara:strand:+ start:255 stop:695 length:441 start_codon:yes stop_codon:yes gene_type:complete
MANETSNNTADNNTADDGNVTADIVQTVEESGILDTLLDSPELMVCAAIIALLGAYIAYTQPAVRVLVMPYVNKFLKTHEAKIEALLEENLTKAQKVAYSKLDETLQAQVKNEVLRNVVLTAWDEKDGELKNLVKGKVKNALNNVK